MRLFFEHLINSTTAKEISNSPKASNDFSFNKTGWYFFVSPISGILKIKIVKETGCTINDSDLLRFLNFKVLLVIGCDNPTEFTEMYQFASENLSLFNKLQKKTIEAVGQNKIQINSPGIYKLKLLHDTVNYVNYWKYGDSNPYFLFNAIDSNVLNTHLEQFDFKTIDDYLNDPFYYFMYDLDGLMIYKKYVDESVIADLKVGRIYECKIDYIARDSSHFVDKQLAIKKIYLPIKIDPF